MPASSPPPSPAPSTCDAAHTAPDRTLATVKVSVPIPRIPAAVGTTLRSPGTKRAVSTLIAPRRRR